MMHENHLKRDDAGVVIINLESRASWSLGARVEMNGSGDLVEAKSFQKKVVLVWQGKKKLKGVEISTTQLSHN